MKNKLFLPLFLLPCAAAAIELPTINHYAFANYLGSGLYTSSGQTAAVANLPFSVALTSAKDAELILRLPLSVGFFNYRWQELPEGEFPDAVGTITLTPGIEYHWQATRRLRMESYFDIGFGYNFADSSNVGIMSVGVSALYSFGAPRYSAQWIIRIYNAGYRSMETDTDDYYQALSTGVDTGLGLGFNALNRYMDPRLFLVMHRYFGRGDRTEDLAGALIGDSFLEGGVSLAFDRPMGIAPVTFERIGLSYSQVSGDGVWRLFFSLPL